MKIEVDYNRHTYKGDAVHIAIGFNVGIATKYYKRGKSDAKTGNLAFSNIFVNYIKYLNEVIFDSFVGRTTTVFTVKSSMENMVEDLIKNIRYFSDLEIPIEKFVEVKKLTIDNFKREYKNGDFRARYKALEVADIVKGYTFDGLVSDLANVEYEEFVALYNELIKCGKCNVFVNGNIRDLSLEEIEAISRLSDCELDSTIWCGKMLDYYVFDDAHIIEVAREACNVSALHFSFDKSINVLDKFLWTTIEAERIPDKDKESNVDWYDASLIARTADVVSLKSYIASEISEEEYKKAKNSILMKYFRVIEKNPITYAQRFLEMKNSNCDLNDYLQTLDRLVYAEYIRVSKKISPYITEAQIIMRRSIQ